MPHKVLMPKFGNDVESCLLSEWFKKEGDSVAEGELLCKVETEKAVFDVVSPGAGTLLKIYSEPGSDVPINSLIAFLGGPEDPVPSTIQVPSGLTKKSSETNFSSPVPAQSGPSKTETKPALPEHKTNPDALGSPAAGDSYGKISKRAGKLSGRLGVSVTGLAGSGPGGRIIERDILALAAGRPALSPLAVERIATGGFSAPPTGSGPGGRILSSDLSAAVREYDDIPVKGIRKIIAERMRRSMTLSTQCTLHSSAAADRLLELRAEFKNDPVMRPVTITDILLHIVSRALKDHPVMNSHFLGSTMRIFHTVHLGLAVDTPKGLLVPVIRNADRLSLKDLSAESKRLGTACQEGTALPAELTGSSFTVTNLGNLGVEMFTPILNWPETAILGVCAIADRPVRVPDGSVRLVPFIGLSLTFNHEAVDGAPAARFLKTIADAVEATSDRSFR